jgi:hypothetical protein
MKSVKNNIFKMKIVKKPGINALRLTLIALIALHVPQLTTSQISPDVITDSAISGSGPDEDPSLNEITPATKEEVDQALDDDLETMNRDETRLNDEDEMALQELAQGYNPMTESSEASDNYNELEDEITIEREDTAKNHGLFDLESNSEQEHLLNFKKITDDFKVIEEKYLDCLRKIPQEAWVLRELVICVGANFYKINEATDFEKKKLLSRAETRVRRVMTDECYSDAGLDLSQSRSCDLVEKDVLELLWDEMNYPALVKYHKEKYTFTYGKLRSDDFDKYMGFFAELYRRDNELIEEMINHSKITLLNIKKFIDDTTEHYEAEAKANGYEFNLDLTQQGLHSLENHHHFHAIGAYDANFSHTHEDERFHDYHGDHAVNIEGHDAHGSQGETRTEHGHRISESGAFVNGPSKGPPAHNTGDILDKYGVETSEETSETSEEYAQRIKDLAGYQEPEEVAESEEDQEVSEAEPVDSKKFRRNLNNRVRVQSRINNKFKRSRMYHMNQKPVHYRPVRRMADHVKVKTNRRSNVHQSHELRRIHDKLTKRMKPRKLKDQVTTEDDSSKELNKSIADILKDYSKKLPGLKSGNLGHLLKV